MKRENVTGSILSTRSCQSRVRSANRGREESAAIPVELAAILIEVSVFAAQFPALAARGRVVAVVHITAQFTMVMSDPGLIVTNVAAQAMVTVPGQRGCD